MRFEDVALVEGQDQMKRLGGLTLILLIVTLVAITLMASLPCLF